MSTGKINRRALPEPGRRQIQGNGAIVAPRTPVEITLAQIWAEVLFLNEVGIHDTFFSLGGHSLAASQIVSRVLRHFRTQIPLQALFQSPTVAEMTALINEHLKEPLGNEELENILKEIESLSDADAQRLVSEHGRNDPQR